jgi:hypothetical protein
LSEKDVLHGICEVAEFFKFSGYFGRKGSKQSGNSAQISLLQFALTIDIIVF